MGTSFGRSLVTDSIISWLQRNSSTDQAGRTPHDAWLSFLNRQVTNTANKTKDLENIWLCQRITTLAAAAPPVGSTNTDLWTRYLQLKGHTGDLNDMFAQWLDHGTI